jgi:hypothetical protein
MDNEMSHNVEAFIAAEKVNSNTPPPHMRHTNLAERAVRTWKNHFTAGIAGLPPSFPPAHWCRLMAQIDATLYMMCPCCLNPLLSAHKALEGTFLFDATLIAPLGMEVLVHQIPSWCKTWGHHAAKVWYLSHAAAHYHFILVIMKDMGGKHVTNMFHYQHHAIPVPVINVKHYLINVT